DKGDGTIDVDGGQADIVVGMRAIPIREHTKRGTTSAREDACEAAAVLIRTEGDAASGIDCGGFTEIAETGAGELRDIRRLRTSEKTCVASTGDIAGLSSDDSAAVHGEE